VVYDNGKTDKGLVTDGCRNIDWGPMQPSGEQRQAFRSGKISLPKALRVALHCCHCTIYTLHYLYTALRLRHCTAATLYCCHYTVLLPLPALLPLHYTTLHYTTLHCCCCHYISSRPLISSDYLSATCRCAWYTLYTVLIRYIHYALYTLYTVLIHYIHYTHTLYSYTVYTILIHHTLHSIHYTGTRGL
jgi:hypothetical protein